MKLLVGLGNLDDKYAHTRHNIGHQFIDRLKQKCPPEIKLGTNDGYMNESGSSVQRQVNFYKVNLTDFYLVHDDLDLPVGEWRLQFDRGAAGHHGVESVVQHLGSQAFWRIRIGIGRPDGEMPIERYVLQKFTPEEKSQIDQTIDKIVHDITIITQGS